MPSEDPPKPAFLVPGMRVSLITPPKSVGPGAWRRPFFFKDWVDERH